MAAPKGNKFWELRTRHGRKPIFDSPEDMWNACVEYFEWVANNDFTSPTSVIYQGKVRKVTRHHKRAMSIKGMCVFLGIPHTTWYEYCKRQDYLNITTRIEGVIYAQKFEGAAAEVFNANLIARDLQIADVTKQQNEDAELTPWSDVTAGIDDA